MNLKRKSLIPLIESESKPNSLVKQNRDRRRREMPQAVRIESPKDGRKVVHFKNNRAHRKNYEDQHLPHISTLRELRQTPNHPTEPTDDACEDVHFHVVRVVESVVTQVGEVVKEEQHAQQS